MLELEIVPERSVGCEQWEFVLGEYCVRMCARGCIIKFYLVVLSKMKMKQIMCTNFTVYCWSNLSRQSIIKLKVKEAVSSVYINCLSV